MKKIPTLALQNVLKSGRVIALAMLMGFFYALSNIESGVSLRSTGVMPFVNLVSEFCSGQGSTAFCFQQLNSFTNAKFKEESYHLSEAERDNNRTKLTRLRTLPGIFQKTQSNHGGKLPKGTHSRQGQNLYRSTSQFARAYPLQRNALPNGTSLINQTHRSTTKLHSCRVAPYCLIFKIS